MTTEYSIIRDPGKFEGELSIVPKMWNIVMEGFAAEVFFSESEPVYAFVSLLAIDEPIGELYGACLWEDSQGFVRTQWYETEQEYNSALHKLETEATEFVDNSVD